MLLNHLVLQYFRSYTQSDFAFSPKITYIVGPNTSGKSNILESIYLLSSGKSYRADVDSQMVKFGEEIGRVKGLIAEAADKTELEVVLAKDEVTNFSTKETDVGKFKKKYFVNGVARGKLKFAWNLKSLLFVPSHLDIIVGSPSLRRNFLNEVLELSHLDYHHSLIQYEKALRQRNALLQTTRETGIRNESQFVYWNNLVIAHGNVISQKRWELVQFINSSSREVADIEVTYDKSEISIERLFKYKEAEVASGVTLVGPHRDDFFVELKDEKMTGKRNVKHFGSRGQQRLVVLQLKLLQLEYTEKILGARPLLLLDDIFSELDDSHIHLVMEMVTKQQTIITTTHEEFIVDRRMKEDLIIELGG